MDRGSRWSRRPRLDGPGWAILVTVVVVVLLNLVQQPGRITFDTKLDLSFAAWDFLARSLDLWNGDAAVGGLQNQASGYLFPMGPVFVLGDWLGAAPWIWERLWSAAVMLVAFEGARRLARAWPGIGDWGAVVSGLAFMLAPRILTTVGVISGEALPAAILPWTVLPLVHYLRGSWARWPALVLSAASVLWMGGQNAVLVLACLVLPGLLLLLGGGRERSRVLADVAAWSGLVLVACAWWIGPLLLLGAYAPPFLDFIESSRNTASATGWLSSLRGTDHWVAFFPDGGSAGWTGGWELASSPWLLVTTVAVAGIGLAGIVLGRLGFRVPLVASMLLGLAVLTAGSGGLAGSVLSGAWLDALDGALAPLRNVHKFDPLVRLPLSLGVGAFVSVVVPRLARPVRGWGVDRVRIGLGAAVAALLVAAAQPALAGQLRSADGMTDISPSWRQAVTYLDGLEGPVEVLVLPGAGFAVQTWGRTVDEPVQVLGGPPWLARAQVTVAPPGTLRVLDAVERRVAEGRPIPRLGRVLRRLGVTHVIVRSDLDPEETDAPDPERVRASVVDSGGMTPLAAFADAPGKPVTLEVLEVGNPRDPRVTLQRWEDPVVVGGGPEALVGLSSGGLLGRLDAAVAAGSGDEADDSPARVLTDTARRVERSFGRVHDAVSAVMTPNEPFRVERRVHDYVGDDVPVARTVAEYDGLSQVLASSSVGYADTFGAVRPEGHPWAALDDSVFTAWESEPFADVEGQWIELRFAQAASLGALSLQFDVVTGAPVGAVRVVHDGGSRVVEVGTDGRVNAVDLPAGTTKRLRVVVEEAGESRRPVRLTDLRIDGRDLGRTLRLPGQLEQDATVLVSAEAPQRACTRADDVVTCSATGQVETTETREFSRTVTVAEDGAWDLRGWAVATHGPAPLALFAPLRDEEVAILGSSTFAGDPAVAPAFAFDARPETSWYASPVDPNPVLELSWAAPRTIRSVTAALSRDAPGHLPDSFLVDPLDGRTEPQLVSLTGPDAGAMKPVRGATRLRLTAVSDRAGEEDEAVGVSELSVDGIEDLRHSADAATRTGLLCGFGPTVEVDGRTRSLRVRGSLDDVVSGRPMRVSLCGRAPLAMNAGQRRLTVSSPDGFAVSSLWLRPSGESGAGSVAGTADLPGAAAVATWGPTDRAVEVSADEESVLAVTESFNEGWEAELSGAPLQPVLVDGWKQGFVVPSGTQGRVELRYAPQRAFEASLVAGAVLAGLLAVGAAVLWRRRTNSAARPRVEPPVEAPPAAGASRPRTAVAVLLLVGSALVSVPLAVGMLLGGASAVSRSARPHGAVDRTRDRLAGWVPLLGCLSLAVAVVLTLLLAESVIDPPEAADVLVAGAVGIAVGLMWRPRLSSSAPAGAPTTQRAGVGRDAGTTARASEDRHGVR